MTSNLRNMTKSLQTHGDLQRNVGLGETSRRFILERCRYSSLDKLEGAFDTALYLMQTK